VTAAAPARCRHSLVGLLGLVAACAVQHGLPSLTVARRAGGLSLARIALLVSAAIPGRATASGLGAVAALAAVPVVPGGAVEQRPVDPAVLP
jgi:hypothetical protein